MTTDVHAGDAPQRNYSLIAAVRDKIASSPSSHNQSWWIGVRCSDGHDLPLLVEDDGETQIEITCGTTACVAGWAALIEQEPLRWDTGFASFKPVADDGDWWATGRRLLGLSYTEGARLFDASNGRAYVIAELDALLAEQGSEA